jgi:hypothetical protein
MKIIPLRGLSIDGQHAPSGVPVETSDAKGKELIELGVARKAPPEPPAPAVEAPAAPVVETAAIIPPAEHAAPPPAPRKRLRS